MAPVFRSERHRGDAGRRGGARAGLAATQLAAVAVLTGLVPSVAARAVEPGPEEQLAVIGAALVYNIARFSSWPAIDDDGTFDVCLADTGAIEAFRTIEDRKVGDRAVRVRSVLTRELATAGCQVYFTSSADRSAVPKEAPYGTLIVGTTSDLLETGGAVRIGLDGQRPAFGVNVVNAARAGVEPSSQLLQLAEEVVQ